jgi:hypothetical protein
MQSIHFTPAADPLGHTAPLDHRASFPLLGKPLEVRSNSANVIAAAERSFHRWRALDAASIEAAEPCVVSVVVQAGGTQRAAQHGMIVRVHSECLVATDGANLLTAQLDRGFALGFVTPELVADEARLRYNVLEMLALSMVAWHDRTPVHAGAVVRNGCAVLLAGQSMAGKSTLCYACLREGFQLLAEDVVYVSRRGGMRLWGVPWHIHLLPDAARLFAELADVPAVLQPNGKRKLAVETSTFGADRPRCYAERAVVCVVERQAGAESALEWIDPCVPVAALSYDREAGFDLYGDTRMVAESLAAEGAYRLRVGSDLAGAVALLRGLTDRPTTNGRRPTTTDDRPPTTNHRQHDRAVGDDRRPTTDDRHHGSLDNKFPTHQR